MDYEKMSELLEMLNIQIAELKYDLAQRDARIKELETQLDAILSITEVPEESYPYEPYMICPSCRGNGRILTDECPTCCGNGSIKLS